MLLQEILYCKSQIVKITLITIGHKKLSVFAFLYLSIYRSYFRNPIEAHVGTPYQRNRRSYEALRQR